ncbi:M20/M25/M40 family metallo-hydrolase [Patescibacteria group bacterium]
MTKSKVVEEFTKLVQIDSPSGEEEEVCEYVANYLESLGIKSSRDKTGNLFARVDGVGEPILLSAHMDTVEPGRGIVPVTRNKIIYSFGDTILGADNKAALAAILSVMHTFDAGKRRNLELLFTVREETGGGVSEFDFGKMRSKYGLIADRADTIGSIVMSSPWIMGMSIKVIGKPAHAGMPEGSINALSTASSAISKLRWGRLSELVTTNIGTIKGGSVVNTVPGSVAMEGEIRSFAEKSMKKQLSLVSKIFKNEAEKVGAKVKINTKMYCSGYVHKSDSKAVIEAEKATRNAGFQAKHTTSFGGSDANTFVARGIQVVNIGYGAKYTHTKRERISIKDLEGLTKIISDYISVS